MSEQQYEIEQRMHDALAARDKRIEELCLEIRHLRKRVMKAEVEVRRLKNEISKAQMRIKKLLERGVVFNTPGDLYVINHVFESSIYDEPLYGDA